MKGIECLPFLSANNIWNITRLQYYTHIQGAYSVTYSWYKYNGFCFIKIVFFCYVLLKGLHYNRNNKVINLDLHINIVQTRINIGSLI